MSTSNETLWGKALRLVKSAGVGVLATLADLAVLALLVEVFGLAPAAANVPALLAGALVQFLGCRHLVFGSQSGSLRRQVVGFVLTEAGTLALNAFLFHVLVTWTPIPYAAARPVATFLVFVGFSYPLWTKVFAQSSVAKVPRTASETIGP